jgi:hypothetical protein
MTSIVELTNLHSYSKRGTSDGLDMSTWMRTTPQTEMQGATTIEVGRDLEEAVADQARW